MSKPEETQIPLKILVDTVRNKVLYAEADSSFVDVLFSFMTLPLGTIIRLIKKNSNSTSIGCLNSLYEGLANLPPQYFSSEDYKLVLLHPRNSSEVHCSQLKLNVDDSCKYFMCESENWECYRRAHYNGQISIFSTKKCCCGKLLNREIDLRNPNVHPKQGVFVTETARFMITDDLRVLPSLPGSSIKVLGDLGIRDMRLLEERTVNIGLQEVLKLLELALLSGSPLTDLFLRNTNNVQHPVISKPGNLPRPKNTADSSTTSKKMDVRVFVQKSNGKLLFLQAEENFVDFFLCFLTIPLGNVVGLLHSDTSAGCIDELYRSISELNVGRYIRSDNIKYMLLNPQLAWHHVCNNKIFELKCAHYPSYFCCSYRLGDNQLTGYLDLSRTSYGHLEEKHSCLGFIGQLSYKGFVKGPAMFMVTNDLVVTPLTSLSGMYFLDKLKVPLSDVEEREVSIGIDEGLRILRASLTSSSALSSVIDLFFKKPKQEQ